MSHTRRTFIKTTAAAVGATVLPHGRSFGQSTKTFVRWNVNDPKAAPMLASYKKAIRAMLALPPSDPRNWYRNALTHTLDCPHGNWWFLPWHRGYLGYFEQICRELSGDPDFAMPYWDWSHNPDPSKPFRPILPPAVFDDVLTPTSPVYIAAFKDFEARFKTVMANAGYWAPSNPFDARTQYGQLLARGLRFNDDLWFDIQSDPRGKYFYELAHARGLTKARPELDQDTANAVSLATLLASLRPADFVSFGSARAPNHGASRGSGPLEANPHNLVHNNVGGVFTVIGPDGKPITTNAGGFMQDLLSPVDPIFFLHHANIDRLWDVWTRKQQNRGLPILPDGYMTSPPVEGTDYYRWSSEPFLFFVDAKGKPAAGTTAGDFASIGSFAYEYQPGSGEEVVAVPPTLARSAARGSVQVFRASPPPAAAAAAARPGPARTFAIPAALLQASAPSADVPALFAKVTVDLSSLPHGTRLRLFVNAPAGGPVNAASPHHAGTLALFGHAQHAGEFTFTVPLSRALTAMRSSDRLNANAPLTLRVVADTATMTHGEPVLTVARPADVQVLAMTIEAH